MIEPRVIVIGATEQENRDAIFCFDGLEDGAPLLLHVEVELVERLPPFARGVVVLVLGNP